MSKGDFEDLAALWREDPDPGEREELEQLAQKARRRGRLTDYADIGVVAFLVVSSIVAAFAAQSPPLMAATVVLIIATVWLTIKRRKIRQMSRSLNTQDRQSFFDSSIRNVRANLRRNTLSLIFFPLVAPLALVVKLGSRTGGDPRAIVAGMVEWAGTPRGMITITIVLLIVAFVVRARRRLKAELRELRDLRLTYEDEARRDAEAEL